MRVLNRLMMSAAVAVASAGAASAAEVEVLHWWTAGGEAAALNVLKQDLEGQGITWRDMPVAGRPIVAVGDEQAEHLFSFTSEIIHRSIWASF